MPTFDSVAPQWTIILIVRTTEIVGFEISYTLCRALPDTALVLRDVIREAARIWAASLGSERYEEIASTEDGKNFFMGRVRLEPIPPEREMIAVWLPFPPDFAAAVKPQLVDYIEPFEPLDGALPPPDGWPGWRD